MKINDLEMKVSIGYKEIDGPWGGGNNFRIQLFQIVLFYNKVLKFIYIKINAIT